LRNDHVRARREQRVCDELDDFVRTVSQNQIRRLDTEFYGEFLFEIKRIAVGIKVHAGNRLLHRGHRERRRAERIFVRRDLDDRVGGQIQFARDFFNWPARLIDRQRFQKLDLMAVTFGIKANQLFFSRSRFWRRCRG
jgi:hypothetical protein